MSVIYAFQLVFAFSSLIFLVTSNDYFAQFEEVMKTEHARQASSDLHSQFNSDKPKEIEIVCASTPTVSIRDLMQNSEDDGECMYVLTVFRYVKDFLYVDYSSYSFQT